MALLKVLKYPHPNLKLKAVAVDCFDQSLEQTVQDMFETMYDEGGVGLAAIQVNIQKKILVMDVSENQKEPLCIINPTIIDQQGTIISEEACLSFPGISAKVKRAETITTEYYDEKGKKHQRTSTDLEARCLQHEIDHLNGVNYVDHLSKLKRSMLLKKMTKLEQIEE